MKSFSLEAGSSEKKNLKSTDLDLEPGKESKTHYHTAETADMTVHVTFAVVRRRYVQYCPVGCDYLYSSILRAQRE